MSTFTIFLLAFTLVCHGVKAQMVEIPCSDECEVREVPALSGSSTWKFLCDSTCEAIGMFDVQFPRFPREIFLTHPGLKELVVRGATLQELTVGDFAYARDLQILELKAEKLSTLGLNCFSGAFELRSLNLSQASITEFPSSALAGLEKLEVVELQYNNIQEITGDHFKGMTNLRKVDLSYNVIEHIDPNAFRDSTCIDSINITYNNFTTEVDLQLSHVSVGTLNFQRNKITKLTIRSTANDAPVESPDAISFYANNNNMKELYIPPNFPISTLVLNVNSFANVLYLPPLKTVRTVNLQQNKFVDMRGQRIASRFANMRQLNLINNKMERFDKETFTGCNQLEKLELSANLLQDVDFPRMNSLSSLSLNNNSLSEFPYKDNVKDTFPVLETIYLANNDFDPDYLEELVIKLHEQGVNTIL